MTRIARARKSAETHVTCLDCGLEFKYDWAAMRIGQPDVSHGYDFEQSAKQVAFCEAVTAGMPTARK